jgi:chorismate synthase
MFIEVLHDTIGNIISCYCSDTLPVADGSPFAVYSRIPDGCAQARININTVTAMEIEAGCGQKAILDEVTGRPVIVNIPSSEYIMSNFTVDLSSGVHTPSAVNMPAGMKMLGLVRRA